MDVRAAELNSTPPNRRPLPFRLNNLVTSPTGLAASRPGGSHSHQTPAPAEVATEAGPTPDTPFGPTPSSQPDTPPDELRSLASTPSPIRAAMGMQLRPRRTKPPVKPPPPISLPAHTRRGPLKDELHREELREWNEATGTDDRYALPLQTMAHTVSGQPEGTAKRLTGVGNEERRPIKDRWGNVWGMESHLLSPLTCVRTLSLRISADEDLRQRTDRRQVNDRSLAVDPPIESIPGREIVTFRPICSQQQLAPPTAQLSGPQQPEDHALSAGTSCRRGYVSRGVTTQAACFRRGLCAHLRSSVAVGRPFSRESRCRIDCRWSFYATRDRRRRPSQVCDPAKPCLGCQRGLGRGCPRRAIRKERAAPPAEAAAGRTQE